MPCRIPLRPASVLLAAAVFSACHGGSGSKDHGGGPPTQIDLTVTAFQVAGRRARIEGPTTFTCP